MENNSFVIPLNGLAVSGEHFLWQAGKEFFESFDNSEISDAEFRVECSAVKSARKVLVDCRVTGYLIVSCDRCLEDLRMPLSLDISLAVMFGDGEETADEQREVVVVDSTDAELDLRQIIYDYVCLSLPIQRVHPDGECNQDTVAYMGDANVKDSDTDEEMYNPFSSLKGLF